LNEASGDAFLSSDNGVDDVTSIQPCKRLLLFVSVTGGGRRAANKTKRMQEKFSGVIIS
jgi:hypothetical protein